MKNKTKLQYLKSVSIQYLVYVSKFSRLHRFYSLSERKTRIKSLKIMSKEQSVADALEAEVEVKLKLKN